MKYQARFNNADYGDWKAIDAFSASGAAEEYAELAQVDFMWESSDNNWTGDYSIVVQNVESGELTRFNIERRLEPVFSARVAS